ncbi:MAG: flagellar biosynthesis regulator FlaF [Alphaproteobacteria bacterium]
MTEKNSLQGPALEASVLIKCASEINYLREHWDEQKSNLDSVLEKNRKVWTILSSSLLEEGNPQPDAVKNNISNLALFIFQRTMDILLHPEPERLKILVDINMNIAQGLSGNA